MSQGGLSSHATALNSLETTSEGCEEAPCIDVPACGHFVADPRGGILWCPHLYNVSGSLSPHGPLLDSWPDLEFLLRLAPEPKFLTS